MKWIFAKFEKSNQLTKNIHLHGNPGSSHYLPFGAIVAPQKFHGNSTRCKSAVTQSVMQHVEHSFVTYLTSAANSHAVHRQSAYNREARRWTVLFSTWGRPVRRLSWTAYLPSRDASTHIATVRYGNAASPHASRSPWKHYCLLRHRATSILIRGLRALAATLWKSTFCTLQ